MKQIYFINGSPRNEKSVSQYYIEEVKKLLEKDKVQTKEVCAFKAIKENTLEETFKGVLQADCIVFVFSLYIDTLHSELIYFLEQFETFIQQQEGRNKQVPRVYAICNNGFIEGSHNQYALQSIKHFAKRTHLKWQFGLGLGAGEMMFATKDVMLLNFKVKRPVYDALLTLREALMEEEEGEREDLLTNLALSKTLFALMGNQFWKEGAKKNQLKAKELKKRVYIQ